MVGLRAEDEEIEEPMDGRYFKTRQSHYDSILNWSCAGSEAIISLRPRQKLNKRIMVQSFLSNGGPDKITVSITLPGKSETLPNLELKMCTVRWRFR